MIYCSHSTITGPSLNFVSVSLSLSRCSWLRCLFCRALVGCLSSCSALLPSWALSWIRSRCSWLLPYLFFSSSLSCSFSSHFTLLRLRLFLALLLEVEFTLLLFVDITRDINKLTFVSSQVLNFKLADE